MAESVPPDQQLQLGDKSIPEGTKAECEAIWKLLQEVTSLSVVADFLKSRKQHFSSGSWDEMLEKRIFPLIARGMLTTNDLASLLSEAEQFGRCHVFLYKTTKEKALQLLDDSRIKGLCEKKKTLSLLNGSVIWNTPITPTLSSIKTDTDAGNTSKTFRVLETRSERQFLKEEIVNDIITRSWKQANVRAVNSLRLHPSGLLEIRIQSHHSSTKYEADITRIWKVIGDFLPVTEFSPFSLSKAKSKLWAARGDLTKKIRFKDSLLMNAVGTSMLTSTGDEQGDLFADTNASASIDTFLEGRGAYCDSANIWFLPVENVFEREVHVLLSGQDNEFAITANCTKTEYDYVLNELRLHSK